MSFKKNRLVAFLAVKENGVDVIVVHILA